MVNADKVIRLGDYVRLERAQKSKDGANFKYDASTGRVTNLAEYFAAHADPNIYTVRFPLWTTSNSTQGVKLDDNAGLSIVPSTNTVSGRDDYRSLPAFRVWDVNGASTTPAIRLSRPSRTRPAHGPPTARMATRSS
jgi:hypothetical protein